MPIPQPDVSATITADEPKQGAAAPAPFTISRRTHCFVLMVCATVVGLAMTMSIEGSEKVALPGMVSPLPELCHLKRVFHLPCPGCGLTRSFISMGHFNLMAAAAYNIVGIPLFLFTLMQIPYRAYWLWRPDQKQMTLRGLRLEGGFMVGICVLLVAQWLVKMALGQL
jgi:hypothetical protein